MKNIKHLLCKIGIHDWNKPTRVSHSFASNIYDMKKICKKCKKVKKWIIVKKD